MLLDTGTLHCDPHPGNLLRTTDGRLCVLDWGMTLQVPPDLQYALLEFIAHVNRLVMAAHPSGQRASRVFYIPPCLTSRVQISASLCVCVHVFVVPPLCPCYSIIWRPRFLENVCASWLPFGRPPCFSNACISEDYEAIPGDFVNLGFTPPDQLEKVQKSGLTEGLTFALRQLSQGGGANKMRERLKARKPHPTHTRTHKRTRDQRPIL